MYNYKEPKELLSSGKTNAKMKKNKIDFSYILYMSPYTQNSKGINVCPKASAGCAEACLYSAGMGRFSNVKKARINKTEFWIKDKKSFYTLLAKELDKYIEKANGQKIAFRLNGTSDIDHHKMLKSFAGWDFESCPDNVVFYDYTKIPQKALKYKDSENYFITFSRSEENELQCIDMLDSGINVAVVFSGQLPKTWKGFPVIDGDKTDERFLDATGVVVGLSAKGDAENDTTGFVVQI